MILKNHVLQLYIFGYFPVPLNILKLSTHIYTQGDRLDSQRSTHKIELEATYPATSSPAAEPVSAVSSTSGGADAGEDTAAKNAASCKKKVAIEFSIKEK